MGLIDQPIRCILDLVFLLTCQSLVVRNVQMSLLLSLLGAGLPDVRSEHLSAGGEYDVRSCVMGLQLCPSFRINSAVDSLSNDAILRQLLVNLV